MIMKNLLFLFLFLPFLGSSQPEFSFDLYFEDALGNRDTITLGYDPQATDGIDEFLAEENINNQQWDNNFEVRVLQKNSFELASLNQNIISPHIQFKKQIVSKTCDYNFPISLCIKSENFPITVYWDSSIFLENECTNGSMISTYPFFQCDDIGLFDSFMGYVPDYSEYCSNMIVLENDGSDYIQKLNSEVGLLSFLWLTFANKNNIQNYIWPGCPGWLAVNELNKSQKIKISPNPVNSNSTLHISNGENYFLYNVHGNLLENGIIENNTLDLKNRPSGVYFLQIENKGTLYTTKLIIL
jgi:hypothetical protein